MILIKDDFTGPKSADAKVFTMNLMATGNVGIPASGGDVSYAPIQRTYGESASTGTVYPIDAGLKRFQFTGQQFGAAGVTPAIDFDLYTHASSGLSTLVGNWADTWHPGEEMQEFQTQNGSSFEERQHILRLKGNGGFKVLLLPRRKGQPAPTAS